MSFTFTLALPGPLDQEHAYILFHRRQKPVGFVKMKVIAHRQCGEDDTYRSIAGTYCTGLVPPTCLPGTLDLQYAARLVKNHCILVCRPKRLVALGMVERAVVFVMHLLDKNMLHASVSIALAPHSTTGMTIE